MFGLMMLVFLMWSRDERAAINGRSWFERARQENLATLIASPQPAAAERAGGIDDDEHLAAYNAYLARLHQRPPTGAG